MQLEEVKKAVNGSIQFERTPAVRLNGVATDSRQIKPGELFIALVGEKYDGHDFIENAAANGAGAVLASRDRFPETRDYPVPVITVDNTLKALQDLAHYHRKQFSIPVIAVTGSNGKTT